MSSLALPRTDEGQRICQVIRVRPERLAEYKKVHADVWPGVLAALRRAHIADYSIHYFAPLSILIAHMRYMGSDLKADMEAVKLDETTRKWWEMTDGMQGTFVDGSTGSGDDKGWWMNAEEVFRMEG